MLGCRVDANGKPYGASERRVLRAARAYVENDAPWVIVSGGIPWHGVFEADAFAERLIALGVPKTKILIEKRSRRTRQNAVYSVALASQSGIRSLFVVTCDWHLPRALAAFRHSGIEAAGIAAASPEGTASLHAFSERVKSFADWLALRLERLGILIGVALLFSATIGCDRAPTESGSQKASRVAPSTEPLSTAADLPLIVRIITAEQARKTDAVPIEALTHRAPRVREAAARALARIADASAVERLLPALSDEVPSVVAYAAFGLGRARSGRESELTRALVLRAISFQLDEPGAPEHGGALTSLAAALGRLGTDEAERSLAAWLGFPPPLAESAALALGQLGARRGRLGDATLVLLLEAAAKHEHPTNAALHAFSRVAPRDGLLVERALALARRPIVAGAGREYRIRALARLGVLEELWKTLSRPDLSNTEAAEVARALAEKGDAAQGFLEDALIGLVPEDMAHVAALVDQSKFHVISVVLEGLRRGGRAKDALTRLTGLSIPNGDPPRLRRVVRLRCGAARVLAGDDYRHPGLGSCDPNPEGRAGKLALLRVVGSGSLRGNRKERYQALASDADPSVRQAALRLIPAHRELEAPATLFAEALLATAPGTRAVAAEVLSQHPDRANEVRRKSTQENQPEPRVVEALTRAIREPKATDTVGVRTALLDAAAALGLLGSLSELEKACDSDILSLRVHAERAFAQLGRSGRRCPFPARTPPPPEELARLIWDPTRLIFETDIGELTLEIDPRSAPVAATRIVDLARSGFYDGTLVHRVVPGFVVQFGDREGDGYGGAPRPALRSEPNPEPFEAFSVGIAESGEDTGSSQLFVTLGRFAHLDGDATRLGRAGKGWDRLIEGDRILRVRIEK